MFLSTNSLILIRALYISAISAAVAAFVYIFFLGVTLHNEYPIFQTRDMIYDVLKVQLLHCGVGASIWEALSDLPSDKIPVYLFTSHDRQML